jgi:hypothetical protein
MKEPCTVHVDVVKPDPDKSPLMWRVVVMPELREAGNGMRFMFARPEKMRAFVVGALGVPSRKLNAGGPHDTSADEIPGVEIDFNTLAEDSSEKLTDRWVARFLVDCGEVESFAAGIQALGTELGLRNTAEAALLEDDVIRKKDLVQRVGLTRRSENSPWSCRWRYHPDYKS